MEPRFQLLNNGQELQQTDVNLIADDAALADDRVIAEFLRLPYYDGVTVTKGVLPYTDHHANTELVRPSGSNNGRVMVAPFRAIIGSRTAVATDSKKNWRDIRTTIYLGSATALSGTIGPLAPGNSINPRWDLIYAIVTPDADAAGVSRYVKNPTTENIAASTIVTTQSTTISIAVVTGTAGASPALPAIPADGASYYIPLAYVRTGPTFTGGATGILGSDIYVVAPCVPMDRASGVITCRPATSQNTANQTGSGPAGLSTAAIGTWGSSGVYPKTYLPPTACGAEKLLIALDLTNASSASWSIANYGVVDDSRDWRKHLFFSWGMAGYPSGGSASFAWLSAASPIPNATFSGGIPLYKLATLAGQSFLSNMTAGASGFAGPHDGGMVFQATDQTMDFLNAGATIYLYVDDTDGKLKFYNVGGNPRAYVFICLEAIGPIPGT